MKVSRISSALILIALAGSPALAAPQIGDKAPAVKIAKWMTHEPPALPGDTDADKHVFLVEFWATWCGPCWASIPHLGELHNKYEKDGLVIIGVTVEEPEVVAKFIGSDKAGKKMAMPYFVGIDDEMGTTGVWTKDVRGIPYAFLVDKSGQVVWQGNPLGEVDAMDAAIPKVLAGKYSVEEAKEVAAKEKKFAETLSTLQMAYGSHDEEKTFGVLDNLMHLKPMELQPYLIKRQMLTEFKKEGQIPAWNAKILEQFKD
jgi:thiol-disulfide isomerase/thioredoxin